MDPDTAVWTLVRELVTQQRSVAKIERKLMAIQADHAARPENIVSLRNDLKNASDLAALHHLWRTKTLPSLVAQLAVTLEVHDAFGGEPITIDDPVDAALWKSKYFVAVEDMTASLSWDV
jgi:hypothetical protein